MRKAVFFDRDGTINADRGYVYKLEDLEFLPGIPKLIKNFNDIGYLIIVITNQSGIARSYFSVNDMERFHVEMNRRLRIEHGAHIDDFYYCPHLPEITGKCDCRKPKPGLFLRAIKDYDIDVKQSVSFGNSERDREASERAGIMTYYDINTRDIL